MTQIIQADRLEAFFIDQAHLDAAVEAGEQAKPLLLLTHSVGPLPQEGDKIVLSGRSYDVHGRTFSYEPGLQRVMIRLSERA